MIDLAHKIGGLVMDVYLPATPASILEITPPKAAGTLRDHCPRNAAYRAEAIAAEPADPGHSWDVADGGSDLVITAAGFGQDPAFWQTFLRMCHKVRRGGHLCIIAPSNGVAERRPHDFWRFYPDAGFALERFAAAQNLAITLIESFTAERENDGRNEFCAVFRAGPASDALNCDFVYKRLPCTNVITWRTSRILNREDVPEDMRLLRAAQLSIRDAEDAARTQNEKSASRHERREAELMQQIAALRVEADLRADTCERLQRQLAVETAQADRERDRSAALAKENEALTQAKTSAERKLNERFREIAGLTRLIQARDQAIVAERQRSDWLRSIIMILTRGRENTMNLRLMTLLPAWIVQRRQSRLLARRGLFDAHAYLAANPDVKSKGLDPLRHYINYGLVEGRSIGLSDRGN